MVLAAQHFDRVQSVDSEKLVGTLQASRKTTYVAVHANHPREIDASVERALAQLRRRLPDRLQAFLDRVPFARRDSGRKATTFKADISKRDDVYAAIEHTEKQLGGFDIMINNAGITEPHALLEMTPEEWDKAD